MPLDLYVGIGTGIVALTLMLLIGVPETLQRRLFGAPSGDKAFAPPFRPAGRALRQASGPAPVSLLTSLLLAALLLLGAYGPRDPLANLLPLSVWTLWWIGVLVLAGLFGAPRIALNPWSGVLRHVLRQPAGSPGAYPLPAAWGAWPGVLTLLALCGFVLADPAPDDPARLAIIVLSWWAATLLTMLAVGERDWANRGECLSMLVTRFAALSPWQFDAAGRRRVGLPGRALLGGPTPADGVVPGAAVFCLVVLGSGSFDGLANTFAWLDLLGVNPLEFPGRSALIGSTLCGLVLFNAVLVALFAAAARLGAHWAHRAGAPRTGAGQAFDALAPSVLPIAFAYHLAHYLPGLLVNAQYALVALGDPLGRGADPFGLGPWFVSTGFFNVPSSVALIWFVQAAAVVAGHLLALLLAHRIALRLYRDRRHAVIAQLPMAAFMLGYTLFGLWLLATPSAA